MLPLPLCLPPPPNTWPSSGTRTRARPGYSASLGLPELSLHGGNLLRFRLEEALVRFSLPCHSALVTCKRPLPLSQLSNLPRPRGELLSVVSRVSLQPPLKIHFLPPHRCHVSFQAPLLGSPRRRRPLCLSQLLGPRLKPLKLSVLDANFSAKLLCTFAARALHLSKLLLELVSLPLGFLDFLVHFGHFRLVVRFHCLEPFPLLRYSLDNELLALECDVKGSNNFL